MLSVPSGCIFGPDPFMDCMIWMSFITYFKSFFCGNALPARHRGAWHAGSHQLGIRRSPSAGCWPGAFSRRVSRSSSRDGRAAGQAQGLPPAQQVSYPYRTPIIRMVHVADHEQCTSALPANRCQHAERCQQGPTLQLRGLQEGESQACPSMTCRVSLFSVPATPGRTEGSFRGRRDSDQPESSASSLT